MPKYELRLNPKSKSTTLSAGCTNGRHDNCFKLACPCKCHKTGK